MNQSRPQKSELDQKYMKREIENKVIKQEQRGSNGQNTIKVPRIPSKVKSCALREEKKETDVQ